MLRDRCIVCGSNKLYLVLDLGSMPSSNYLPSKSDLPNVRSYPLKYYACKECGLFQLLEISDASEQFKNYLYMTGVSKELVVHFKDFAAAVARKTNKKDTAVVVGSNDGTEVLLLKDAGFKNVVGVEPATQIAKIANEKGAETIDAFFDQGVADKILKRYGKSDLVVANNVFEHMPDPKGALMTMRSLIGGTGSIVMEVHWLKSVVEELEIEALYAEHYYVWAIRPMLTLADSCGLKVVDVLYMPKQHGGSLRFTLMAVGSHDTLLEREEEKAGIYSQEVMGKLQHRAELRGKSLLKLISSLKSQGKRVAIWSVPVKVPTLVNFAGLTSKDIDCAYEISQGKIGKYIPKANIPIKDEKLLEEDMPDYLIIGAWNYLDFAKSKLKWYTDKGGKLINPLTCEIL